MTALIVQETPGGRPFPAIHMKCCNDYVRAWPNAVQYAFVAWCPRYSAPVRMPIVEAGGSTNHFFVGE
jgi:hypothetical protein